MLLSIITVTKDNAAGLKMTARSLEVQQNAPEFEWIVIDGASTDRTGNIITDFSALNPVSVSEPDKGIYDAMNKGIDRAKGDYLWFLNAGDALSDLNVLRDVARELRSAFLPDFLFGDAREDGHIKTAKDMDAFTGGQITHHQAMLYSRKAVGDLRYDTQYKIAADYDFTLRFVSQAKKFHYMSRILCDFQTGGVSQKNAEAARLENFEIRKNLSFVSPIHNKIIFWKNSAAWEIKNRFPKLFWSVRSFLSRPSDNNVLAQWRSENRPFRPKPPFSRRKNR
jgi:putative colanic acid biosynthesis glycosyltransferase